MDDYKRTKANETFRDFREKGLSAEEIRHICLMIYTMEHPAPKTSESVCIPILESHRLICQKDWLQENILEPLRAEIFIPTESGNTQESGKKLEVSVEAILNLKGIPHKKAGSQQPIDFRNVLANEDTGEIFIETKKTDTTRIILNDSCPKPGSWYIIRCVKSKKIIMILADILLKNNEDELSDYKRLNECIRYDYKSVGDFNAASRMNLSIDIRRYIESNQEVFWDINEDIPER